MRTVFDTLKYFTYGEKWGAPERISGLLLLTLDRVRESLGHTIVIHCGYEAAGRVANSQHTIGNAVDYHVEGIPFYDAYTMQSAIFDFLQISDRIGFGIYPDWNTPGFHLDVRGTRARWGAVHARDAQGNKLYNGRAPVWNYIGIEAAAEYALKKLPRPL